MRVLVAGATGAIGRPLVKQLLDAGHDVIGLVRSVSSAKPLKKAGALAAVVDVFDGPGLTQAVRAAKPEVVIHQLTALPKRIDPKRIERDLALTNRLRTEATTNLVAAARAAGARRFVSQSVAFAYAPGPNGLRVETDPLFENPPKRFAGMLEAIRSLEQQTLSTPGLEGVVLRYGAFYGVGTYYGPGGAVFEDIQRRRVPILGGGAGMTSFIHVKDAAAASVRATGEGPPGIYNIVDDEPTTTREWITELARLLEAPAPWKVPRWVGRLVAGPYAVYLMCLMPGASNAKAKAELGWQPMRPSWRKGFAELALRAKAKAAERG